jgi:outer membrane protein assembly factor BamB
MQVSDRFSARLTLFAVLCASQPAAIAKDPDQSQWTSFRGPTAQGISPSANLPLNWGADQNIRWKSEIPGPGASTPVIWNDAVYVTCYTGYLVTPDQPGRQEDLQRHLLCFDRLSGRLQRQLSVAAALPEEERIREHGFAASSPAVDADLVCCFFGKSGVIAWNHEGKQLWKTSVGSRTHGWGSAASPVIHGNLIFINASVESQSLVALDRLTGREVWRAGEIREAWNTPLVVINTAGQEELIIGTHGTIRAYEPTSGELLWTCRTDISWYMVPGPVAHDGVVYFLGGRSGTASLAVRTGGRGDVTETHRLWTSLRGSNVSSPVLRNGKLFWMHDSRATAYCAEAATGELHYERRVNRAGQVYSSALLAGDRIYYLTRSGRTVIVQANTEFEQLADNDLGDRSPFNGSFAVDGNRLFVRSDRWLYCIEEQ